MPDYKGNLHKLWEVGKRAGIFDKSTTEAQFTERMQGQGYRSQIWRAMPQYNMGFSQLKTFGDFEKAFTNPQLLQQQRAVRYGKGNAAKGGQQAAPTSQATGQQSVAPTQQQAAPPQMVKSKIPSTPYDYSRPFSQRMVDGELLREQNTQNRQSAAAQAQGIANNQLKKIRERNKLVEGVPESIAATQREYADRVAKQAVKDMGIDMSKIAKHGAQESDRKAREYEASQIAKYGVQGTAGMSGFTTAKIANKQRSTEKILDEAIKKGTAGLQQYVNTHKAKIQYDAAAMGMNAVDYVKNVLNPNIANNIAKEVSPYIDEEMMRMYSPTGAGDYIASRILNESVLGQIASFAGTTKEQRQYMQQGLQAIREGKNPNGYKPSGTVELAGTALSFVADAPVFAIGCAGANAVASKAVNAAGGKLASKGALGFLSANGEKIGRMVAQGTISGSLNLGAYNAVSSAVSQSSVGDVNLSEIWKSTGSGLLTGGILGVAGVGAQRLTKNWGVSSRKGLVGLSRGAAAKKVAQGAAGAATRFLTEVGAFATASSAEQFLSGEEVTWTDNLAESAGTVVGMKLGGMMQKGVSSVAGGGLKGIANNMRQSLTQLVSDGYHGMKMSATEKRLLLENTNASSLNEALNVLSKGGTDAKDTASAYGKLMADKTIPFDVRQRISLTLTGTAQMSRPRTGYFGIESDMSGERPEERYVMREYSKDGEVLSISSFRTWDEVRESQEAKLAKRNSDWVSGMLAHGALSVRTKDGITPLVRVTDEDLLSPALADERKAFFMGEVLIDNEGNEIHYDPTKGETEGDNALFLEQVKKGGALYDVYKETMKGMTATELTIMEVAKEHGYTAEKGLDITHRNPLELTAEEGAFMADLSARLHDRIFKKGEPHVEQSAEEGASLADNTGAGVEDNADLTSIKVAIKQELDEATAAFEKVMEGNDVFKSLYEENKDKSPAELMQIFLDSGANDDQFGALVDVLNARAKMQGFLDQTSKNIDMTVQRGVQERSFRGTIDGQPNDSQIIRAVDKSGKEYVIANGAIMTDGAGHITSTDAVICFADDGTLEHKVVRGSELTLLEPMDKAAWGEAYREQVQQMWSSRFAEAGIVDVVTEEDKRPSEKTNKTNETAETSEHTIGTSSEEEKQGGLELSEGQKKSIVSQMGEKAEKVRDLELTPENWIAEFGEDGTVETPIGNVKMGDNQYLKLLKKGRSTYFGMVKPTLTNPDLILEEYDPKDGAERDTKYLFVKTFVKADGSRYVHFESVTVQKDNLEVSISSHEINEEALNKKVHQDKLIHLNDKFSSSERRLTEPNEEGSDLVPTPNTNSGGKDTETSATAQENGENNAGGGNATAEAARQAETDTAPEWRYDTPEAARQRGFKKIEGVRYDRQGKVSGIMGKVVNVFFHSGSGGNVTGRNTLLELNDIQASHRNGQENPLHFISDAQPKDRRDKNSQIAAKNNADAFNPELSASTADSFGAYNNAQPTVNGRGEVIQGNGRMEMFYYVYENAESAAKYKEWLKAHAEELGFSSSDIDKMEKPVLVVVADVDDKRAVELGQKTAADLESGGTRRMDAKRIINAAIAKNKLGTIMRKLFETKEEDATISELLDNNGITVLKWMNQHGIISAEELLTAVKNGRLTEEGRADLRKVVENFLFEGGDNSLRDAYENLPAATKKALLSTLWKSVAAKENGEKARRFIQESIVAFNELLNDEHFKNARNEKEVRVAIADWKKEVDFISGKHSEKFTNFAVELAARYKFYKQRDLTRLMGEFLDSMAPDEEQSFVPKEVLDITEAAKQYFGLTDIYGEKKNGEERPTTGRGGGDVKPVSESGSTSSPQGEPVSPAIPASGERTAAGTGTTERRARSGNGRIKPTTAEDAAKDLTARRGKGEKIDTGVTEDDVRKRIEAIRKRRAQQSKPQQPKDDGTMPALTIEDEQDVREIAKYCLGNGNLSFEDFARAIHESLSGVIDDIDNYLVSTYMGLKFNPDVPKELRDKMDITNAMRYGNDEKAFKEFINQIDKGNEEEKGNEGRISGETPVAGGNEIPVGESMGPGLGHELGRPVAGERPRGGDPSGAGRGISGELGESGHPDGGNDKPKSDAGYKHQDDKKESSPSDSELNGGVGSGTSQPDTGSVPSDVHTGAAEGGIGAGRTNATNVGDEKDIHPEGGEKNSGDHGRTLEAGDKATAERSGSGAQGTGLAGGERMGSPVGTGTANDSGRSGEQPTNTRVQSQLTSDYSPYEAHGGGATEEERTSTQDIIIPTKIAASVSKVLQGIKDIKGFVAKKLGFSDTVALSKVLSPVQVDGVALAIKEVEKGGSVVIGDDTGVGKGRQAAAVISYAHKQGKIPVFFTAKKDLLSDIYRDLRDIGEGGLRPFIVSGSKEAAMKDEDGNVVWNIPSEKELNAFYKTGVLPKGYDCVVLPYSSYTGSNSKLKEKGTLPKLLSGDTVLVMDESHTVSSNADFRGFVENSKNGVVFLSATSSKRPEHLIQYILRKGINESGMSAEDVLDVIKRGGTALQEAFTQMLAKSGGYIRRERNQEGVEVEWEKADTTSEAATVAKKKYDDVIDLYKEIAAFEKDWVGEVLQIMTTDPGTRKLRGMVGVDVIPYVEPKKIKNSAVSGRLFNLTQQALLSIKADHVADRAIEQWKKGLKPVIALHNTNEGLFKAPAGGAMEKGDLSVVLERMLTHSALSTSGEMHVDDNQMLGFIAALGGQSAYDALLKKIRAFDSGLTVSPIDHIRERLEAAGMRVGELTGRATRINTTSGKPMVESRSKEDRDKKAVARKFNNGEYDVLILNESSATGISLHASETFADKRQRVMIIAQPQLDVNVEKQVRGRIDRTGQVVRGKYIYVQSPIGTENRQMSMLRKKFTSLNAQTKATGNDNDIDAYDLDNSYGEQAALQAFRDNPEIYQNLSKDLFGWIKDGEFDPDAADPGKVDINEVLKQIQSLRTSEQEEIYNAIFENYKEIVDYHEKLGDNELHTQSLPLEAETIAVEGYTEGANPKSDNLLAQDSRAEYVRMKNLRKPYPWRKVLDEAKKLGVTKMRDPEAYEHYVQDIVKKAKAYYEARCKEMIDKVIKQKLANLHATKIYQTATPESQRRMEQDAVKSAEEDKKVLKFRNEMYGIYGEDFSGAGAIRGGHFGAMVTGGFYSVPYNLEKPSQSAHSFGMFLGFKYDTKNMRGAGVKAVFAVADSRRIVEISLRHKDTLAMICDPKTNRARDFWDDFVEKHRDLAGEDGIMKPETVWDGYVATKSGDMRDGIIITGNIVAAWHDPRTARNGGTIVQYTDNKGNIKIGILLGDEAVKERYGAGKAIITAEGKLQKRGDSVRDSAGHVKITVGSYDITLEVNYLDKTASSKKSGAVDIWRDKKLKELLKDDSNYGTYHPKRGGHAYIYFSPQNLHAVLAHLNDAYKLKYNEETAGEKALRERFGFKIDADDNTFESTKRKMVNGFGALAKILNLPDDAISLYHELTLTVRDRENKEPRALAYYNRTSRKLWTRPADVSSLGHEWFHALDDYFAKLYAGASERYGKYEPWVRYSRQLATEGSLDPGGREEIASAYGQLVKALNTSGFLGRMKAMGLDRYWTSAPEMTARAFESYIKERYFEKYGEEEAMKMWGDKTSGMNALLSNMERFDRGKYGVYPTKEEMTVLRPAFDNLFNSIKTTKSDIGGGRTVLFRLGDEPTTFEERQKKAVENKGTVMAGLNEAEVKVVDVPRHEYKGTAVEAKQQAITDATKRYNGKTLHYDNHGAKFDYTISDKSIDESMNSKAIAKSSNMGAHIAVLNQLDKVIGESIEVEEHPDYQKKDGVRNPESGINTKALVHRFIGAVNIGGETYRVKTTMIEHRDKNHGNKEYSYEVTNVELLEGKSSSSSNGVSNVSDVFVTGAKLLQGVEKSYEKGKKLLDESEKSNTNSDKTTRFRTSQQLNETPQSRAIRTHVTRLSEKLGGERFETIEDADHIEDEEMRSYIEQMHERGKRVPGWYDIKTGKVHLLMSDVRSRYDAERTILHETVGHKGMRHLLGENGYRKYMNMLWRDKSLTGLHEWVNDRMTKNGYDLYTAIDEYIAESAEGLAHKEGLGFWQKVRNAISTVLHEIGYRFSPNIKDVKYMTWLAKHEMSRGDVMSEAKRQSLLRRINAETLEEPTSRDDRRFVDKEASKENAVAARSEDEEIPDSSVRLRAADEELHDDDTPIAAYKKMKYERSMQENRKRWEEGHLDNMTAYRELEKALVGDDVLKDSENAYWAENHMSSIVEEAESRFANQQMKKLHGAVKRVMTAFTGNKKEKLRQVNDYIYTKTGLERNRVLEVRDFVRELREVSVAQLEGDVQRMRHIETLSDAEVAEMANHPTKLGTFLQGMKGMKIPSTLKQAVKNMPSSWVSNPSLLRDELNKIDSNIPNARMKWKHIASARYYKTQNPQDNRSEVEIATEEVTTAWKNTKSFSDKELDARNIGADEYFDGLDQFIRDEISEDYDAGKRDKSGLSAMDENAPNGEYDDAEMIRKMMDSEDMIGNGDVDALWQAIRDCTQFSLDYDYNSGLHSKNVHDKLADEFHWYVPLRGFEEPTAGDMYDYMHSDIGFNMAGKSIVMNADGRKSKADEIIPMIGLMASNAIRRGERNKVKQRMLNLVRHYNDPNNPKSNLVSVSRAWATKHIVDGKEVWEMEQPDIPEGATGDEIAQIVNDFNDRMKTLQANGDAKIVRERSNMQYRATAKQKNEHVVDVCVNGEHYYLTVNGDPRAAQAINGALGGVNSGVMGKINRFMSAAFTSYSPTFMVTNTSRDFQEASVNLTVKEGGQYVARFEKNYATAINNIVRRGELWKEYRAGTIGQSVNRKGKSKSAADMRLERYFKEFLDNGGKTGHIEVKNLDKYKDELVQKVREKKVTPKHILQLVGGAIEHMNERAENAARFATYLTSRELGRSVLRSVHDAKEVTVNFNRKGSGIKAASGWTPEGGVQFKASYAKEAIKKAATLGKYDMGKEASSYWAGVTAEFPRQAYLFWNAGMQDLAMKYRIAKKSPAKFVGGMVIGYAAAGAMMAVINNALANWLDDEDYSNKYSPYANLPEWTRRNNICIYLGKKQGFLKIPIPIFLRGFYGIGDIAAGYLYDENLKSIDSSLAEDVAGQITQMLPLDFLGEGNSALDAAVPDFAKPLAQNMTGKDWTGKPLERQNMWDENAPKWTRAYKSENKITVGITKKLNDLTNGDAPASVKSGWINLSPAEIDNLISGYTGGAGSAIAEVAALGRAALKADFKDIDSHDVPIIKAFIQTPSDRTANFRLRTKFYKAVDDARETKHMLSRAKADLSDPYTYAWYLKHAKGAEQQKAIKILRASKMISKLNKVINDPVSEDERKGAEAAKIEWMNYALSEAQSE